MGLDFSKTKTQASAMANTVDARNEIEVVETYDIVEDRQQMNAVLVGSQEVDDIVSTIEINNLETIVSFWRGGRRGDFQGVRCGFEQREYVPA